MKGQLFAVYRWIVGVFTGTRIGEWGPIAWLHRAAMSRLKPSTIELDGFELELDPGDSLGLTLGHGYEEFERRLLASWVRPGDVVLDVGANLGLYTLHFSRLVGPDGRVIAYEPDPLNADLLRRNLDRNGVSNVEVRQIAVSDSAGSLELYLCERNRGDHRTYDSHDGRPAVAVAAARLDDESCIHGRVDLIKMDIQGAEERALAGMERLLRENGDLVLVVEFWPAGLVRSGGSASAFLDRLRSVGFGIHEIDESGRRVVPVTVHELLDRYRPDVEDHTNLLCTRRPVGG